MGWLNLARTKKTLNDRIRGWLPKESSSPNVFKAVARNGSLLILGNWVFPTVGVALIAGYCYSSLLVFCNVHVVVSAMWVLLAGFLVGVEVALVGTALRTKLKAEETARSSKPIFHVGAAVLSLSVFSFIFTCLYAGYSATYPFSVNSWLVRWLIYLGVSWVGLASLILGFAGGVLLLVSGAFSSRSPQNGLVAKNRRGLTFYVLAVGSAIALAAALLEEIIPLFPGVFPSVIGPTYAFYALLEPLGIVCLTFGWATLAIANSKKSAFFMPVFYAGVVVVMAVSFMFFL
jgi:hypothetical protein